MPKILYRMATFNDRLQAYQQRPDAVNFSNKQIHRLHNAIAWVFNRNRPGYVHTYVEARHGNKTILVRNYPEVFTPTIDGLINKLHDRFYVPPAPRQRKRIPARAQRVYSSKI